ncbi:DDE-type integrase/transposase/recombinase [Siminovitchia sp. 179-K 8D1 HS]|uniref:DDE-type integrase/transposase/recombinase n=1 Tax=Siminovitchia sp. 179-K 8D1 HS TaxID=3142385 RepID=UPI0039A3C292
MNHEERKNIALFRYGLISSLVSRKLQKGELAEQLRIIAGREHIDQDGKLRRISKRTLERYLHAYRKHGFEGLMPAYRGEYAPRAINQEVLAKAVQLKKERPERAVSQIIRMMELAGIVEVGDVAESTLSKQLRKLGLTKKKLQNKQSDRFRRFEFPYRNACWQGDVQHTLYLPHPDKPGQKVLAKLFAFMDDFSRFIVHAEFHLQERGPQLEDCLRRAIHSHGKPEQIYVDNGAIYRADMFELACAHLGIKLSHSTPRRPQGRGKMERFFQFIDSSFKPEAYDLIESGKIDCVEQLNRYLYIWLNTFYHDRKHGETKQTPRERFYESEAPYVSVRLEELDRAFMWQAERKVDKTGCVSFQGNRYEVDQSLVGELITLRYEPLDLSKIEVWHSEKRYEDASPIKLNRATDRRIEEPEVEDESPSVEPSGLNFLELNAPLQEKKQKEQRGKLSYAKLWESEQS